MLGNILIRKLAIENRLIDNFDEDCLRNCSYRLRVGKLIKPGGVNIIDLNGKEPYTKKWHQIWRKKLARWIYPEKNERTESPMMPADKWYELKPNELIIFQTKEKVKIPKYLSASYTALDSVAKQGILLINSSIVEPGYEGYLSGVLLNFSSESFMIKPDMVIVKINFSKVSGDVKDKLHDKRENKTYTEDLRLKAQKYTPTFLDIDKIENEVIAKTSQKVRRNFVFGGILLVLMLAFCTIEPVLYNLVWHDSWVPLTSTHIEYERAMQKRREMLVIDSLTRKVDSLQISIEKKDEGVQNTSSQSGV